MLIWVTYIKFLDFLNTYNFGVTSSMDLLGGHSGSSTNAIKDGSMVIKDYKKGCLLADYITEIGKHFEFHTEQSFVKAIVRVSKKEGFCLDTFLNKIQIKPLQKRTDINAYVEHIAETKTFVMSIKDQYLDLCEARVEALVKENELLMKFISRDYSLKGISEETVNALFQSFKANENTTKS